ncbi:Gfo/Idh/MocA family oxidoreductase [Pseudonocardia bannensis]|uniref:Gfo/Idh/MocA family oxidoreductase n=1 Tax=Pseudonocardia bannensis TaxID=630973 RepID=A0A848DJ29_9PSEU|nr:Gfo/Idh/MocA family oxidoreductase [Pseudonocardia bannensis]NMH92712.1 Gfo/Idh/MocA family oxidoreductase [Pseudonocardia bannensis]
MVRAAANGSAKCRIGFVGTGSVAHRHARILSGFDDVVLVAATDVDPDRTAAFCRGYGGRPERDVEALLRHDLDAVYVCVPPFAHGTPEEQLADAGVALFVEKPPARDEATAERIGGRLADAGTLARVGHHWRLGRPVRQALEVLAGRTVRLVHGRWVDRVPPVSWWAHPERSGGQVVEQAVHVLDLARVLVGEVTEVHALPAGSPPGPNGDPVVDAATAAILRFDGGAVGTLGTTCALGWKDGAGLEIVTDDLVLQVGEYGLEVRDADGTHRHSADPAIAREAADRAFVDAVLGVSPPPEPDLPDYSEALRSHRLACALARSAASRQPEPVRRAGRPGAAGDGDGRARERITRTAPVRGADGAKRGSATSGPAPACTDRALVIDGPGSATVQDLPREPGPVAVETVYSGLSAGTELSFYTGTHPALSACFDPELGLFQRDRAAAGYPVTRLGYMEVARLRSGVVPGAEPGALVAMTYGHRAGYAADPLRDRIIVLPRDLDPLLGIYVAHMGPICANGLLYAAAEECGTDVRTLGDGVRGRRVAVMGAGVVGLLSGLFARRHGADEVVVLDPDPARRAAAEGLGLEGLDPDAGDPAVVLKTRWRRGPGDRGADVVLQCRGRTAALACALRLCRPQGTVVDLAFYTDAGAALRLGEEFHHNGLALRCAQIGRVPRGTAHRWDRERLSAETVGLLRTDGSALRKHLVTDVLPLAEGPSLLADLAARRRHVGQAVLTFDDAR